MSIYPEGKYRARARSGEIGEAKTGTVQVAVDFEFVGGELAGKHITWFGYFSEKTIDRTLESLRYAGWLGQDPDNLTSLSRADVPEVELVIVHEDTLPDEKTGEIKKRARVQWVNRTRVEMKQLDPAKKAAFGQSLKARLAAVDQELKGSTPPPSKPPNGSAGAPAGDTPDVPF